MDVFIEYIVKKKKTAQDYLKAVGIVFACVIVWMLLLMFNRYLLGLGLFLIVGAGWGAWKLIQGINVEYEYILTNSEMDVDRIVAKMRRKRMLSMDFKTIELCARCDDPEFRHEFENTASIAKTYDVRGGENQAYFVDYVAGESGKTRILFCPNEKMLESIKKMAPRTVHL